MTIKRAFTFVELLVVIAIMGILTVIAVSQFQGAKKKANDVSRKGDLNGVSKALTMYFADYGKFPEASINGNIMLNGEDVKWGEGFIDNGYVYSKLLPKENKDDFPEFCYKTDDKRKGYALFAQLENDRDLQCDRNGDGKVDRTDMVYKCGGGTYCFAITSPNFDLSAEGVIIIPDITIPVPPSSPTPTKGFGKPSLVPTAVPTTVINCAKDGEKCPVHMPCCNSSSSCVDNVCKPCAAAGSFCDFTITCCNGLTCKSNMCGGGSIL